MQSAGVNHARARALAILFRLAENILEPNAVAAHLLGM
jgi:hypothetical protein